MPRWSQRTTEERFWAKVNNIANAECWLWIGAKNDDGYGYFGEVNRHMVRAHRFAYELLVGPIPDGLTLDHLCRTPACVNPAHLEAVSHRTNILRGISFSAQEARITHCPRGHPYNGDNTLYSREKKQRTHRHCRICRKAQCQARQHKAMEGLA